MNITATLAFSTTPKPAYHHIKRSKTRNDQGWIGSELKIAIVQIETNNRLKNGKGSKLLLAFDVQSLDSVCSE